jgi:hypothetical protein
MIQKGDILCNVNFSHIIWCYSIHHPKLDTLGKKVTYIKGIPTVEFKVFNEPTLIVLDDLMSKKNKNSIADLFTQGCHHLGVSVVYITQNIFHKAKEERDISLNANYIVLFKSPRDNSQIRHLAYQMYPNNSTFLTKCFYDATKKPHGYLLLDLKQSTPEKCRVRANIFNEDQPYFPIVYCDVINDESNNVTVSNGYTLE